MDADLIPVKAAAELVGVTESAVYARLDKGKLTHQWRSGELHVSRAACVAWRAEREERARAVLATR